jgi:hypothetical protein
MSQFDITVEGGTSVRLPTAGKYCPKDILVTATGGGGGGKLGQVIDKTVTEITDADLQGATKIGDYVFYNCNNLVSVSLPSSVTSIGKNAFRDCSKLESVNIPDGVTSIGDYAFRTNQFKSINIPDAVTALGEYTFYMCQKLESITVPDLVTSIGRNLFYYCNNMKTATIGAGVTSMGVYAFSYCSSLQSLKMRASTPPTIQSTTFNSFPSTCVITVPIGSGNAYKTATNWSALASQIVEGDV